MKWALVSTVDTMGEDFPGDCVTLFEKEEEAWEYAADVIVRFDDVNTYRDEGGTLFLSGEDYDSPEHFVGDWECTLDMVERFRVFPVKGKLEL